MTEPTLRQRIREQLAKLYTEEEAMVFMAAPQPLLDYMTPARMIAIGDGEEVLRVLKAINDGAHL